jgi:putative DNA primase/helicase
MANEQAENGIERHDLSYVDILTGATGIKEVACGFNLTEKGNANRLIAQYGDNIRYCVNEKSWYLYEEIGDADTKGGVWAFDDKNKIYALAQNIADSIHFEVGFVRENSKQEKRKKQAELHKWALKSESAKGLRAMVEVAESDPRVTVTTSEFNANPWLINCQNGMLDLKARELREARREDLITKIVAVPYEPLTISGEWDERLAEVLDEDQAEFLRRACGSGLAAINRDKALFVLYGEANARKSTLLDAIFKTLGDYAAPVNISVFQRAILKPGGTRVDLVSLEGVRAAQCSEVPRGMKFNDAFLKAVTSANPQSARGLFEKVQRKIIPRTKFYIETNFLPEIDFDDDASFNRFHIISFLHTIPLEDCDPAIKEFLLEDANAQRAIFAWLVKGCYDWQEYGLMAPACVNAARKEYQRSMNPLASFLESECVIEEGAEIRTSELYERFKNVATPEELHTVTSAKSFGVHLSRLGFKSIHERNARLRRGIRLRGLDEYDDL